MLAEQRQKLLGPALARSRPQPRARSAAHDERDDEFRHYNSSSRRIAASWLAIASIPRGEVEDTLFDRRIWPKSHITHQIIDVGASFSHVARLHRRQLPDRAAAKFS